MRASSGYPTPMDGTITTNSPPLPAFALFPAAALLSTLVLVALWHARSKAARFVIFALWLRYLMSGIYQFSFSQSPIGLSWNAVASIGVFAIGLFVVRRRRLFDVALVPLYVFAAAILISGIANNNMAGMLNLLVKLGYLGILILAVVDACEDIGHARFLKLLLWPFILPLGLQAISILLGVSKAAEADGSTSYVGGYAHEAGFSMILATGLLVGCLAERMNPLLKTGVLTACFAGIVLASYRTAMVGILPLIGVQFLTSTTRRFIPEQRALVGGLMAVAILLTGFAGAWLARDRFSDVAIIFDSQAEIIRPLSEFNVADRKVMSGRPYIWSTYIYAYKEGTQLQHLVGLGPDSWSDVSRIYAHNTLISNLYELGVLGVGATLFLWAWMLGLALRIRHGPRLRIIAGHLGFLLLNMATMPLWSIEGNILYAVLCGYTVWWLRQSRRSATESDGQLGLRPDDDERRTLQPA